MQTLRLTAIIAVFSLILSIVYVPQGRSAVLAISSLVVGVDSNPSVSVFHFSLPSSSYYQLLLSSSVRLLYCYVFTCYVPSSSAVFPPHLILFYCHQSVYSPSMPSTLYHCIRSLSSPSDSPSSIRRHSFSCRHHCGRMRYACVFSHFLFLFSIRPVSIVARRVIHYVDSPPSPRSSFV